MNPKNMPALLAGLLAIAALLLAIPSAGSGTLGPDVTITRAIQSLDSGFLDSLTAALNWLGNTPVSVGLGGLAVVLLAYFHRIPGALIVLAGVLARVLNPVLKELLDSPRPDAMAVEVSGAFEGLGFPSGHSSGAMLLYGSLILVLGRLGPFRGQRLLQALGVAMIAGIGFSRIYVGAHWPSDVLGGYLWGASFLIAASAVLERVRTPKAVRDSSSWRRRQGLVWMGELEKN